MDGIRVSARDLWVGYRVKSARGLPLHGQRSWALRGVDLSVAPGEVVGIVGGNGSGKTTFLRTIVGVLTPGKGSLEVSGKVGGLVELRPDADRDLSVRERMVMSGVLLGFRRRDSKLLAGLARDFGELDPAVLNAPVYTLSTGMLLRLEMSLLLNADCDVLAVDELLMGADADFRSRCLDRIGVICAGGGSAVLSSHDPLLLSRCDRILRLEAGLLRTEARSPGSDGGPEGDPGDEPPTRNLANLPPDTST
jgi:ABC-type polysaccharide/polyol phosphate transport system ATPase subunit